MLSSPGPLSISQTKHELSRGDRSSPEDDYCDDGDEEEVGHNVVRYLLVFLFLLQRRSSALEQLYHYS